MQKLEVFDPPLCCSSGVCGPNVDKRLVAFSGAPVHEAMQLRADLGRAGIEPFAWVVNQSLAPLEVNHPLFRARQNYEHRFIEEVRREAERFAIASWLTQEPTGAEGLRRLTADSIAVVSEQAQ